MTGNTRKCGRLGFSAIAVSILLSAATLAGSRTAGAANVSGIMSYRNGSAANRRQLHFEDETTGDIYVAPTTPDGSFTADLPPGTYDLRAERGVIIRYDIRVDKEDVNIGHVVEPPMFDVWRPFQHEGVAETVVDNPAPSTANLGGRPLQAMKYGHEAMAPFGAPVGTPAPESTPLGEAPQAMPTPSSPSAMTEPSYQTSPSYASPSYPSSPAYPTSPTYPSDPSSMMK